MKDLAALILSSNVASDFTPSPGKSCSLPAFTAASRSSMFLTFNCE